MLEKVRKGKSPKVAPVPKLNYLTELLLLFSLRIELFYEFALSLASPCTTGY